MVSYSACRDVLFAVLLCGFSVAGSFQWNLFVSAMARLIYYGSVAVAFPVLRCKREVPEAQFQIPIGWLFALLATTTSLMLFPSLDCGGKLVLAALAVGVVVNVL